MKTHFLVVTASALLLTCPAIPATAQQRSPVPQPTQQQAETEPDVTCGVGGQGIGRGMMGGMMRHGMTGHRGMMNPLALRIIFALMDADGDGTISLEEFQAAHGKIFKAMDVDKDGTISFEEMMNFLHGSGRPQAPSSR